MQGGRSSHRLQGFLGHRLGTLGTKQPPAPPWKLTSGTLCEQLRASGHLGDENTTCLKSMWKQQAQGALGCLPPKYTRGSSVFRGDFHQGREKEYSECCGSCRLLLHVSSCMQLPGDKHLQKAPLHPNTRNHCFTPQHACRHYFV